MTLRTGGCAPEMRITFDRWVVLNAVATGSVPAEVSLLVPALSARLDGDLGVRFGK
jgi:hypothetical protein